MAVVYEDGGAAGVGLSMLAELVVASASAIQGLPCQTTMAAATWTEVRIVGETVFRLPPVDDLSIMRGSAFLGGEIGLTRRQRYLAPIQRGTVGGGLLSVGLAGRLKLGGGGLGPLDRLAQVVETLGGGLGIADEGDQGGDRGEAVGVLGGHGHAGTSTDALRPCCAAIPSSSRLRSMFWKRPPLFPRQRLDALQQLGRDAKRNGFHHKASIRGGCCGTLHRRGNALPTMTARQAFRRGGSPSILRGCRGKADCD
jgi:hypothetical protein